MAEDVHLKKKMIVRNDICCGNSAVTVSGRAYAVKKSVLLMADHLQ
jgi:hypothetical protein